MGTVVTIDLYGEGQLDERELVRSVDAAASVLHDADEVFSTWKPQSPLSRLRRGELSMSEVPAMILAVPRGAYHEVGSIRGRCRAVLIPPGS